MSSFQAVNKTTDAVSTALTAITASSSDMSLTKFCEDFLPGRQPADLREAAQIAARVLKADELTTFMSNLYEFVGEIGDKANEQAAWLSGFESKQGHWKKCGYSSYEEYLPTIDASGRVRRMIEAHSRTVERRDRSSQRVMEYWPKSPELHELIRKEDGEEKWQRLSHLAHLTENRPDLAKKCLNLAYANRLAKRKKKKKDTRWFVSADFKEAQNLLGQIGDKEALSLNLDLDAFELKFWRGILMPVDLYPGQVDLDAQGSRVRTITPSVPPDEKGGSGAQLGGLLTGGKEREGRVEEEEGGQESARRGDELGQEKEEGGGKEEGSQEKTAVVVGTVAPVAADLVERESTLLAADASIPDKTATAHVPPPPPTVSFLTELSDELGLFTAAVEKEAPKPPIVPTGRPEPEYPFEQILQELSGGQLERWGSHSDMVVDGFMDWLTVDDPEVRKIVVLEQAMYRHHLGANVGFIPWSIAQQAMRQDPGLYALAVASHPCGLTTLVTHGMPTDSGHYHAETPLAGGLGDLRVALEGRLSGPKVSTNWIAVHDDHCSLTSPELGSWVDLALSNLEAPAFPAFVRLQTVSALGGACVCNRRLDEPEVEEERAIVLGSDRERAAQFVAETRRRIITEVKRAHQVSTRLEMQWYGDSSFYVKHYTGICAGVLQEMRSGKRVGEEGDEQRESKKARES